MAQIQNATTAVLATIDTISSAARVTIYDTAGGETSYQGKQTFAAAATFTPPATPTDLVTIAGSATKLVKVVSVFITVTTTPTANSHKLILLKRSTPDLAGVFVAATLVPVDANNAVATAIVGHYTTVPATLGTLTGNIWTRQVASPVAIPTTWAAITKDAGYEMLQWNNNKFNGTFLDFPVKLRGTGEMLGVNYAGATLPAGTTFAYSVVWTEE